MKLQSILKSLMIFALMGITITGFSQINNWRPLGQEGLNIFEPAKDADATFDGVKIRLGGAFTQQYQNLSHENDTSVYKGGLYTLAPGFPTAVANLNIYAQLGDGIYVQVENYMSSRHHTEFWVKGGFIQVDKLPMFGSPEWFTKMVRIKVGHFQPNYGDQMLRRTDNGNAAYNPFVGNYIMDAFTTEVGGELYVWPTEGVMVMLGLTNGLIHGDVVERTDGKAKKPSLYLKAAYDKQINEDLRVRVAASMQNNANSGRSTLFGGDRTGSRFYGVMEQEGANLGSAARSGRWNPGFTNQVMATQFNGFVKFQGLEFFGTYEMASGNNLVNNAGTFEFADSNKRSVNQVAAEVIYRFLENEQLFVGFKYNMLSGELNNGYKDADGFMKSTINRTEFGAGWFPVKNLLLKAAYVSQSYTDFPDYTQYYKGKFGGFMIEAVATF